jgi:hypothetical protein
MAAPVWKILDTTSYVPEETKDIHNNLINAVNFLAKIKYQRFPNISQKQYHSSPNSFTSYEVNE